MCCEKSEVLHFTHMLADNLQQWLEYLGAGAHDVAGLHAVVASAEVADHTAGFLYQKQPCGDVPGFQVHFPEAIKTTGGNIGQVQCGSAWAADACGLAGNFVQGSEVGHHVFHGVAIEWDAGTDQRAIEAAAVGYANAAAV